MLISKIRHGQKERKSFRMVRPRGQETYTVFLFQTPVTFELQSTSHPMQGGCCIIYPPGVPQYFTAHGEAVYSWLQVSPECATLLWQYGLPVSQPFHPREVQQAAELLGKMEAEFIARNPFREALLDTYFTALLILLGRAAESPAPASSQKPEKHLDIKEIRQHILSNPQRKWTVTDMAQMMSLSPSRFHAVYKEVFGTSPMQDVIEAKVEYAKSLLLSDKGFTLPQIAEMLGYNDQYHFIRQFRAETGMTPGAYRKSHR